MVFLFVHLICPIYLFQFIHCRKKSCIASRGNISQDTSSLYPLCRCWDDPIFGLRYDDKVSQWLRTFLEIDDDIDLVVFDEKQFAARPSKDKPDFPNVARDYDMAVYHDVCPIHLCSLESVTDLNTRLEKKVKIYNFRPNIIVKTLDKPYAEVTSTRKRHTEKKSLHYRIAGGKLKWAI